MPFVIGVVINAFAVWVAVGVVGGLSFDGDVWKLLLIALILGLVNAAIKPVLKMLSLPLIVLTLGLFILVINWAMFALVVWLAGPARLDLGLASTGFVATFLGALIISLVSWAASTVIKD
jgi:putative membrane protein